VQWAQDKLVTAEFIYSIKTLVSPFFKSPLLQDRIQHDAYSDIMPIALLSLGNHAWYIAYFVFYCVFISYHHMVAGRQGTENVWLGR